MPLVTPTPARGRSLVCAPWADVTELCDGDQLKHDAEDWLLVASDVLYLLTMSTWPGVCHDVAWPCGRPGDSHGAPYWLDRADWGGWFSNASWGGSGFWTSGGCGCNGPEDCGCSPRFKIGLSTDRLISVQEVCIGDGAGPGEVCATPLDSSAYRVDDRKWLVRLDGKSWPCCSNLTHPTFRVKFTHGAAPPVAGKRLAIRLAHQYLLGSCGDEECELPQRVKTISRQGVTIAVLDNFDIFKWGTGLADVDQWVRAVNPGGLRRRMTVWSPELEAETARLGTDR